jgi:hypothetical protein
MERGLLGALGIGIALFGGTFLVYFVNILSAGGTEKTSPSTAAGLVVFFAGVLAVGIFLAWRMFGGYPMASGRSHPGAEAAGGRRGGRRAGSGREDDDPDEQPPATPAERERRILRLAERGRGRVTIPEVAARCAMTVAEAKSELDRLAAAGVAQIQVTQNGVLVYVFPGFLSDEEKASARDF